MNKTVKGSLAGAAGIALLMGGFGSYALWSDSTTQTGDSITSGNMDVTAKAVSWTDNAATPNTLGDVNDWNYLMVPGDVVTRTQKFDFTGAGKNLSGTIRFAPGGKTQPQNAANTPNNPSAADSFNINVSVSGLAHLTSNPAGNCWDFSTAGSDLPETATTTVTYTLIADNQDLQNASAILGDSTFTMTQGDSCS